jgi:cysteine desulfurase
MLPFLGDIYGNPSSVHHVGRRARALLDQSRDEVASLWKCRPSEVIFTSGGTEANNLAILGTARLLRGRGRHIITSSVEHPAVLQACEYLGKKEGFEITVLPVSSDGVIPVDALVAAIRADTILVSLQAANNENGAIHPIAKLGKVCRERGVVFHTDAVQAFGKLPFHDIHQFHADLVSVCAHKFHGPKGAGALFIRSPLLPDPILFGGGHENERRAGTENLAAIVGLTAAMRRFVPNPVFGTPAVASLRADIVSHLEFLGGKGVTIRSPRVEVLPNTIAFTVRGSDSLTLLAALDLEGICGSAGSACSSGSLEPSHVMKAMGVPAGEANALVRFSLGRENGPGDVEAVRAVLGPVIERSLV